MNEPERFATSLLGGNEIIIADVGAAAFLVPNLQWLEPIATLCLFEPGRDEAEALRAKYAARGLLNVRVFNEALGGSNGPRTLYVTATPTGSSLLKPGGYFAESFVDPDYLYPMREITVQTRRLEDVLKDAGLPRLDAIKIDVQGAELEVLEGAGAILNGLLCVELEIGFPGGYVDQPGFGPLDELLRAAGLELFDLRVSHFHRHLKGEAARHGAVSFSVAEEAQSLPRRITEADALYFRRTDHLLSARDPAMLLRQVTMLSAYGFFVEAVDLLDQGCRAGLLSEADAKAKSATVRQWHGASSDAIADSVWFAKLSAFTRRASRFVQKRLLGKHFLRWLE